MTRVVLVLLALSACASERQVRRSTMTPIPMPVRGNGQVADRTTLTIEGDNLVFSKDPQPEESEIELWSPRHQATADIAFRLPQWDNVTMRGIYTRMFRKDAVNLGGPEIKDADGHGLGTGLSATHYGEDGRSAIAFVFEGMVYRLPYVNGDGTALSVTPGAAVGIVPSFKAGRLGLHGGLTLRTSPTIRSKGTVTGSDNTRPSMGNIVVVLSAGAELEIISGLKARVGASYETVGSPVRYAPSVQAGVVIPLSGY